MVKYQIICSWYFRGLRSYFNSWWKKNGAPKMRNNDDAQREGTTTLRIDQYWIFHYTVIETWLKMIKPSELKKWWRHSSFKSPNFLDCSEVRSAWSPNYVFYWILRIEGPGWCYQIIHYFNIVKLSLIISFASFFA